MPDFNAYLKQICAAFEIKYPDDVMVIMELSENPISRSKAQGWTNGSDNRKYRKMTQQEFEQFLDGLFEFHRGEKRN